VPYPVGDDRIEEAEALLGRRLPGGLRDRLMRDNGGEIEVDGYPGDNSIWFLHPVWAPTDRRRISRTANHIVGETREAHDDRRPTRRLGRHRRQWHGRPASPTRRP
jgi:hypothetical protein